MFFFSKYLAYQATVGSHYLKQWSLYLAYSLQLWAVYGDLDLLSLTLTRIRFFLLPLATNVLGKIILSRRLCMQSVSFRQGVSRQTFTIYIGLFLPINGHAPPPKKKTQKPQKTTYGLNFIKRIFITCKIKTN